MNPDDPCWRLLEETYTALPTGFQAPLTERRALDARAGTGSAVYGEITLKSIARVLSWWKPGPSDVVYDLGSGVGKLVLATALFTPAARAVGVELSAFRHGVAGEARRRAAQAAPPSLAVGIEERLELRCEDLRQTVLSDATLIFTGSTCFPDGLLAQVARRCHEAAPRLRSLITARRLPAPWSRRFELIGELPVEMSWLPRVKVQVLAPVRTAGPAAAPA